MIVFLSYLNNSKRRPYGEQRKSGVLSISDNEICILCITTQLGKIPTDMDAKGGTHANRWIANPRCQWVSRHRLMDIKGTRRS